MANGKKPRFGALRPRYRFALNPFSGVRWSRCPRCDKPMHARKFPLLILIEELGLLTLGKTCRYCTPCEYIIADQGELEEQLVIACEERGFPEKAGSEYLVFATVQLGYWKESLKQQSIDLETLRANAADIKAHRQLFDPRPRWVKVDETGRPQGER
ncbi:MAG TPA: hypothetical protein VF006_29290 [Longimicrobium sp.]